MKTKDSSILITLFFVVIPKLILNQADKFSEAAHPILIGEYYRVLLNLFGSFKMADTTVVAG